LADPETYFEMSSREAAAGSPLTIEVEGLDELQEALEKLGADWKQYAGPALGHGLAAIVTDARKEAPVDTGRLRASIGSEILRTAGSEIVGRVGSNIDYASYQEFGTRYQSGKPFLRPALEKNRDRVVKLFEKGIDEALRRLGLKP